MIISNIRVNSKIVLVIISFLIALCLLCPSNNHDLNHIQTDVIKYNPVDNGLTWKNFFYNCDVGVFVTDATGSVPGPHGDEWIRKEGMMTIEQSLIIHMIKNVMKEDGSCHFLDIGSNFGFFSVLAGKHGCKVTMIDANDVNCKYSSINMRLNKLTGNLICKPLGEGDVSFNGWNTGLGGKVLRSVGLSEIDQIGTVNVIKIDIESYEDVLFEQLLHLNKLVRHIIMEITYYLYKYISYEHLHEYLAQHGELRLTSVETGENIPDLRLYIKKQDAQCNKTKTHFCQFNIMIN